MNAILYPALVKGVVTSTNAGIAGICHTILVRVFHP